MSKLTISIDKLINLNTVYLSAVVILTLLIISERNILDILYLGVVTFYYIRIKLHRKNKCH